MHGDEANRNAGGSLSSLYCLAVILDMVYNHVGCDFGDNIMYFFKRLSTADAVCVQHSAALALAANSVLVFSR